MVMVYEEYSFLKKASIFSIVVRVFLLLLAVILAWFSYMLIPIAIAILAITYYYHKSLKVEYEYILINDEFQIDKVIAKEKRKRLDTIDLQYIDYLSYHNDEFYQKYKHNKFKTKKYIAENNKDTEYALMLKQGNLYSCIIIQANSTFIEGIRARHLLQVNL